jgi:glutathione S-transferase
MNAELVLHGTRLSGHTHRVVLLLHLLGLPYRLVETPAAVRASEQFRRLNPLGQIPVLEDGELVLADSNAILVYLAKRHGSGIQWLPEDAVGAAAVQRWLSFAAGEIAYGPARARVLARWGEPGTPLERERAIAAVALAFMDRTLGESQFLAGGQATLADLACYAYVAAAPEGGIELEPYPRVLTWLARVQALPGFVPMPAN